MGADLTWTAVYGPTWRISVQFWSYC